ncbi:Qat anti-phage system associated protein QatB [Marinoscillum sp.]|uniref:Qat anti-phage system associated protein QatB n=1 Tax=Marinoscillum sp. TaxID=2024838 RepID=UPI003BA8CBE7
MGTSSSFGGPKGKSPLLPPWAQDVDSDSEDNNDTGSDQPIESEADSQENEIFGDYSSAKRSLSRFINDRPGYTIKSASKSYVRSLGGAKNASRSSSSGKRAVASFGGFLGNVAKQGVEQALTDLGLQDLIGETSEVVFAGIVDAIAPNGSTNEEADARQAIIDTLDKLYDKFELEDNINKLDSLSEADIKEAVLDSVKAYIYERWLQELSLCIEKNSLTPSDAIRKEADIKEHIKSSVEYDFEDYDVLNMDFTQGDGKNLIESIFQEAYQTLES